MSRRREIRALSRNGGGGGGNASPQEKPFPTARGREVLTWAVSGRTASEIFEILAITKATADEHARTAIRKLDAMTRTRAVAAAHRDSPITI